MTPSDQGLLRRTQCAGQLILPVNVHKCRAAAWYGVLVIRSVLPGYGTVRGYFDEFELHRHARRKRSIKKPIRIVRSEHGTDGCIECRAPVSQFNRAPRQKD